MAGDTIVVFDGYKSELSYKDRKSLQNKLLSLEKEFTAS